MTVADLLTAATSALSRRPGLPDPRREARAVVAAALARSEAWLLAHADDEIDAFLSGRAQAWIERRAAGEPVHRIIGACPFWGRSFLLSPAVLVPRPETELIIEHALTLELPRRARFLDVGTGSGCIAITLALERPAATVVATDRSVGALVAARRNARRLKADLALVGCDLAAAVAGRFDLVTANLPYIPSAGIDALSVEVREHEPRVALDGGDEGTEVLLRLLAGLPAALAPGGWALLELGPGQADPVARAASSLGLTEAGRLLDVGRVERILVLRLS